MPRFALAAAMLAVIIAVILFTQRGPAGPSLSVQRLTGTPRINGREITSRTVLGQGESLQCDGASSARVKVASLGDVELLPGSSLRLLKSSSTSQRFALDSGSLKASVTAPPRLFIVETPSASAVDLGCAYELTVLPTGGSRLRVTAGWVVLESKAGSAYLNSSMVCESDVGGKLQTPYYEDATKEFKDALQRCDGTRTGLPDVLANARPRDALTLWHLLSTSEVKDRAEVYDRLAKLAPPPNNVTRSGILALDPEMLRVWREEMAPVDDIDFWR
jgi:hypothetical protein